MLKDVVLYRGKIVANSPQLNTVMDVGSFLILRNRHEMNTIPYYSRKQGMMVYIISEKKLYTLSNDEKEWKFRDDDWRPINIGEKKSYTNPILINKEIPLKIESENNNLFYLKNVPIYNSEKIYLNGLLQQKGFDKDYLINGKKIYFNNFIDENSKIKVSYIQKSTDSNIRIKNKEIPQGTLDEINTLFYLEDMPEINSEKIYLNGFLQQKGYNLDYQIKENLITFNSPPRKNSKIYCSYRY
jgi:hypothetical protein